MVWEEAGDGGAVPDCGVGRGRKGASNGALGFLGSESERVELLFPRWGSQRRRLLGWFGSGGGHGCRLMHNESEMLEMVGPVGEGGHVRNAREYGVGENEEAAQREEGHQKKGCLRTKPGKCFKQEQMSTQLLRRLLVSGSVEGERN